ncbi:RNA polymerase sigma factor [Sulfitobacter sp. M57]|nr:RNA polymerase sigma factor [Sulfitobacter sp. KE5]MDF3420343.1 RNA polymerase sigma factor [Sulfitobacter sp. KE43]MDF3432921.1 RNA polymerase sigma factor [Sulfitobacter sp. KE42]MDF3458561.1 RNA polymerase sigma factor [Sulfitobacter sp. S74]MDF3462461.1 RNA polymerase sigma factor [Sulfitobacter sp. Ks18]MDF3466362.1 RNA polymerase sigma factor [Sulfitobacter sp. M05]MDF3470257.1 RNA polymerase sigma factor [Sulfitobacter sp. M28]MDF3474004.1 RNA polymerase sigma factor [Sulfitobacter
MADIDPRDELVTHLGALRAFALSLCRNGTLADDLVQETVMKAWKSIGKFEAGTNMRAWLFTILRNTYYTTYTKSRREVADVDGVLSGNLAVKPEHDGKLAYNDFLEAFETLPDDQREALTLVGASGFAYHEAAEMCGVATGTMKSRVNRARQKLVELLDLSPDDSLELTDSGTMAVVVAGQSVRKN